jgi:hypothetical protein
MRITNEAKEQKPGAVETPVQIGQVLYMRAVTGVPPSEATKNDDV